MKTKLLYIAFLLSAFLLVGVVGGIEKTSIGTGTGIAISLILCLVLCCLGIKIERMGADEYD